MSPNDVILITGANTGLGFEIVRALLSSEREYQIILAGRSTAKVDAAITAATREFPSTKSTLSAAQVDIESDESIGKAFDDVKSRFGRVDVLINNAGAQFDGEVATGAMGIRELWNRSWDVNTSGTQVLTHTFVPLLLQSANPRLLFITSGLSSLAETENPKIFVNKSPAKGWPKQGPNVAAYRSSKAGLNMMMREWFRTLREDGVKVWSVSPGFLATGLGPGAESTKKMGAIDPAIGGHLVKDVVEGTRDADVGKVIRKDDIQPW